MQTAAPAAPSLKVAATLPHYSGPLGRFLHEQTQARAAAATLASMRANVLGLVEDQALFNKVERAATEASVAKCQCVAQLQRWFRNLYRLRSSRENWLQEVCETGTYIGALA